MSTGRPVDSLRNGVMARGRVVQMLMYRPQLSVYLSCRAGRIAVAAFAFCLPLSLSEAMPETFGSAAAGCTFPVIEWRSRARSALEWRLGRYYSMLTVKADARLGHGRGEDRSPSLIDEIVCEGTPRMLASELQTEVDARIAQFVAEHGGDGHRLGVRDR
jgi:hypothetical protein